MLRSMFAGVSGLRGHQAMMDVIGNNISNVNTAGYKGGQVIFQDLLSQVLRGAGAPDATNGLGGTNPSQVGLGVRLGSVITSFSQGASQLTGRATDLSILGDGFFVLKNGGQTLYTRLGAFDFDTDGRLVTADGAITQGWLAANGVINTNAPVTDLQMPLGQTMPPVQTTSLSIGGNIPADAAVGTAITTSITTYDANGKAVPFTFTFTKTAADTWSVGLTAPDAGGTPQTIPGFPQVLTFNPTTGLPTAGLTAVTLNAALNTLLGTNFTAGTIAIDLGSAGDPDALLQFAGSNSMAALTQDGAAIGFLRSFSIGSDGVVTGVFSNGRTQPIGQIALATFTNPAGLEKSGSSSYTQSVNSGLPSVGSAGGGGRGTLSGGTLEMSNVDLAQEFTNLIVAQRGFQANSRVITSSDELLQDLVNLKR
ncbi:MAG: flagellar hook protein FlgE [Acidimicrobiia bacterium]|nr:flagellar hook protein FlgE [Acidimicrobiia bacterium]